MEYKITIFGNTVYKEIELSESMESGMVIGTTAGCQVRFNRNYFFDDFEIRVEKQEEHWTAACGENIYFQAQDALKQYFLRLEHGTKLSVNYEKTGSAVFEMEFMIDYERRVQSFDCRVDISGVQQLMIGGNAGCSIRVSELTGGECVRLTDCGTYYCLEDLGGGYGMCVNGFRTKEKSAALYDKDFFSVSGVSFFLRKRSLYTSGKNHLDTQLPVYPENVGNNAFAYPKFTRNARHRYLIPEEPVEVLAPKNKRQEPKKNLLMRILPALVSLVLLVLLRGVMGGGGMFVIYSAATMGMGVLVSVWSTFSDRKEYREEMQKRQDVYLSYISGREEKIQKLREKERMVRQQKYLSIEDDVRLVQNFHSRLFERNREDEDFLELYLGTGTDKAACEVKYKKQEYKETEDELQEYPEYLYEKYQYVEGIPVTLPLGAINAVGFAGQRGCLYQILKNSVIDLAVRQFYEDVKFYFIFEEQDIPQFSWMRWFRNSYNRKSDSRNFMYDEESGKAMLDSLYSELSEREGLSEEQCRRREQAVIFVYRSSVLKVHPVSDYIGKAAALGMTFVFFEEHTELLHSECQYTVTLENGVNQGYITKCSDAKERQGFVYPHISGELAKESAKRLGCVYVDEVSLEGSLTKNISLYELLHIMNASDIQLERRWAEAKVYESMAAPLGVKSGDEMIVLDLHEKSHGPHGLVAGTTGSGKSEILQTYILSMATLYHPYEVSFVIIDFKGGGMVNQFRSLPHLNGAITNIDGREIERSLLSIRAELQKRQELFAQYEVNHIDAYIRKFKSGEAKRPLPHLILIVDEFAELKSDQPEFMKELISTARIGRSLGVHLILATQKPSGVVDNQIWSNSRFRLCLKVQNKEDSAEVLKSPLAAEIKEPGRAYLQVGNNEVFQLFQSAYSGAPAESDSLGAQKSYVISRISLSGKREVIFKQKPEKERHGKTQLQAIVQLVHDYCERHHIERLPDICLPPLAERLVREETVKERAGCQSAASDILVPVGIYDDPAHQLQEETSLNLTRENTFLLGSPQYGKTNLLQAVLKYAAESYSPEDVNFYILDFASMILKSFETMSHVGGVITSNEDEKLKTFMKMMAAEVKIRKELLMKAGVSSFAAYRESGYRNLPQIVLLLDNLTAFKELYPQYDDQLLNLCREGLSVGITVVAANMQTSGVGYKYFAAFAKRIAFYCNDASEYGSFFGSCRMRIGAVPGRAIVEIDKSQYEMQAYLAFAAEKEKEKNEEIKTYISERNQCFPQSAAKKIPEIPKVLTDTYIREHFSESRTNDYEINLGIDFATMELEKLSVAAQGVLGILGRPHSGKKNFVRYLLHSLLERREEAPVELAIVDDISGTWKSYERQASVYTLNFHESGAILRRFGAVLEERYRQMMEGHEEALRNQPLLVLVLQNREALAEISGDREVLEIYKQIVTKYQPLKVCILLSDMENAAVSFGSPEVLKLLKENKNFLIFEELGEQKVHDVPLAVLREYAKPLEAGEAYRICGGNIRKIKTVLETRGE